MLVTLFALITTIYLCNLISYSINITNLHSLYSIYVDCFSEFLYYIYVKRNSGHRIPCTCYALRRNEILNLNHIKNNKKIQNEHIAADSGPGWGSTPIHYIKTYEYPGPSHKTCILNITIKSFLCHLFCPTIHFNIKDDKSLIL